MIIVLLIPDTCLIQHVYASACACMCTLSTASSDAPSSTSTRTVSACPLSLAHINAVLPRSCEHSQVITVQRSIALDEREHAHEYKKKMYVNTYEYTCMYIYEAVCSYIYQSIYIGVCVPAKARPHQRCLTACPRTLADINAVLPSSCEHSQVITVQRSIALDEREHAHEYIYSCQCMHIYTRTQTSPMCVDTFKKKRI